MLAVKINQLNTENFIEPKLDFDLQLHGTRPNRKKYFSLLSNEGLHCNDIMGNQFQIINP